MLYPISDSKLLSIIEKAEEKTDKSVKKLKPVIAANHYKVLEAFRTLRISEECFQGSTGYGYGDYGRDTLECLFAEVFGAEAGLVRTQIMSGTHAIALCLYGILKPGDRVVSITGTPYDTLLKVIGYPESTPSSLTELGIKYSEVSLNSEGLPDYEAITQALTTNKTRMVLIQRSRGYAWRPTLNINQISSLIKHVKSIDPDIICFVDNCYGEFVEEKEPSQVGADIIAGSLIKNPGGGLAPTGGYVVGKKELIERISYRYTAPGIGREIGSASGDTYRLLYQGLFLAPHVVGQALEGAIFTAALFEELGFKVSPTPEEKRSDIIQAIMLENREKLIAFCQGLQKACPVDSHVVPEPWDMPGYEDQVIMAGGTFIQGSTIELSADGPLREPYAVYLQGGLSREYVKLAVINAAANILNLKLF